MKKFPNLLSKINTNNTIADSTSSWPWPAYCQQPRTLSFRTSGDNIFKTLNSVYNPAPDSPPSLSDDSCGGDDESVIHGLRSDRLFFEPEETSSILEEAKLKGIKPGEGENELDWVMKESVVMSMDSEDPYDDFKKSMEEMVEVHGLNDWESLEELLSWYLKVNGKKNHCFIISAFVDLLLSRALASSSSSSSATTSTTTCSSRLSPSSPLSFYTSSSSDDSSTTHCISSLRQQLDNDADDDDEIKI